MTPSASPSASFSTNRRRTAIWNTVFLFAGLAVPIVSGVLLVPIYLNYIDSGIFGLWLASGNILSWISIVDPGLAIVVQQQVAVAFGAKRTNDLNKIVGASLAISLAVSAAFLVMVLAFTLLLPTVLKIASPAVAGELARAFTWAGVGTALSLFSFAVAAINLGLQNSLATGVITVVCQAVRIPAIYICLVLGMGVSSLGIGLFASGLLMAAGQVVLMVVLFRGHGIQAKLSGRGVVNLSGALSFATLLRLGTIGVYYMDLVLVNWILGPASVAVLKFSRTAHDVARPLVQRPAVAIQAPLTHLLAEQGCGESGRRLVTRFLSFEIWAIGLVVALLLGLNGAFVGAWVGPQYFGGATLNTLLAIAFALEISGQILFNVAIAANDLKRASCVSLVQALVFLAVLAGLLRDVGMAAVPIAMIVSVLIAQGVYYPVMLVRSYGFKRAEFLSLGVVFLRTILSSGAAYVACVLFKSPFAGFAGVAATGITGAACFLAVQSIICRQFRIEVRLACDAGQGFLAKLISRT